MNLPGLTETNLRRVIQAIRELAVGGTNAAGSFTLNEGATRTVVEDRACVETSLPLCVPTGPGAAGLAWWVDGVEQGRFTVGHVSATANASFRYELRQP